MRLQQLIVGNGGSDAVMVDAEAFHEMAAVAKEEIGYRVIFKPDSDDDYRFGNILN